MNNSIKIMLVVFIAFSATLFLWKPIRSIVGKSSSEKKNLDQIYKINDKANNESLENVTVINKWHLPEELKEVSGISWMEDNKFACIQDEDGIIFIYNISTNKIEQQIPFAGAGDYEGITIAGSTIYVMRADGLLFKIENYRTSPNVDKYQTPLNDKQDVEGLTYDSKNNRLLASIKSFEKKDQTYKGIYSFDLNTAKMNPAPVYKIELSEKAIEKTNTKKKNKEIQPSEIAVHPKTGEIYLTDATGPSLIILTGNGEFKNRISLNGKEFSQPEGITFSPQGNFYISNEGKKEPGNILEIVLK